MMPPLCAFFAHDFSWEREVGQRLRTTWGDDKVGRVCGSSSPLEACDVSKRRFLGVSRRVVVFARISMRGRLLLVLGDVDDVRAGDVVFRLEGDNTRAEFASIVDGWEAGKLAGEAPARTLVC